MKVLIRQIVYYLGHTWDNLKACTIMKMLIVLMFLISTSSDIVRFFIFAVL